MKLRNILLSAMALMATSGFAADKLSLTSPNGQMQMTFTLSAQGEPVYDLSYKGKAVINPSKLGLELKANSYEEYTAQGATRTASTSQTNLQSGFTLADQQTATFDETWQPVWGETRDIRNHYNELLVTLHQEAQQRDLRIRFRLYDDGLGFRYEFPLSQNLNYFVIKEEHTQFAMTLPGGFPAITTRRSMTTWRPGFLRSAATCERPSHPMPRSIRSLTRVCRPRCR